MLLSVVMTAKGRNPQAMTSISRQVANIKRETHLTQGEGGEEAEARDSTCCLLPRQIYARIRPAVSEYEEEIGH